MKAAILGAGKMGETVHRTLSQSPHVEEIVAYDIRVERVAELAQMGWNATRDLEAVLKDPEVRVCYVTSSNDTHKELVLRALAAGKAVMTEKPMANTLADARAMVEEAERRKAFFQVGFELRYSKLYAKIKEWIDAGLLGEVVNSHCYYIASVWNKDAWRVKKAQCGNMFGEKLSHYVDLPRWWIGSQVDEVVSYCAPNTVPYYEVHDNYHTTYRFANGAVSHLTFMMGPAAHFNGDPLQNVIDQQAGDGHSLRYLVVGTKGAAAADVFARSIKRWAFSDAPAYMNCEWVENLTWDKSEDQRHFHNTHDQNLDIARRVSEGLPPRTPARDAYETMRLCFGAEFSADTGRAVRLDGDLERLEQETPRQPA